MVKKKIVHKKDQGNKGLVFILIVVFVLSLIILILSIYARTSVLTYTQINYTLNVSDYIGLNVDSDKIHFGSVRPGDKSERKLNITSEYEGYVYVKSNDFDWIYVDNQGVRVGPNESANIKFIVVAPNDAISQDIEGTVAIFIMKTNNRWPLFFRFGQIVDVYEVKENTTSSIKLDITQ